MTKEKKIIVGITSILTLIIVILSYFLINKNAIIEKQAEKIELQAMETNGSNSYITTQEHLKEISYNNSLTMTYITGANQDTTIDVSKYKHFTCELTTLHPYVNLYITADGTSIYTLLARNEYTNTTLNFDITDVSNLRIYTTPHANYEYVKGYQLKITLN